MRSRMLLLALGLGLGFGLGRLSARPPEPGPPPPLQGTTPLTCVQLDAPGPNPVAQLAACQARLAQIVGPKTSISAAWSPDAGPEAPEAWTATVEEIFARCDLGYAIEAMDCAEYPCVALLRGGDQAADFKDKLANCPSWRSWSETLTEPEVELLPVDLRCPDGSYESAQVLWIYTERIEENAGGGFDGLADTLMLAGRRNEAVAHQWRCREP